MFSHTCLLVYEEWQQMAVNERKGYLNARSGSVFPQDLGFPRTSTQAY
jgi:hypothetical protein